MDYGNEEIYKMQRFEVLNVEIVRQAQAITIIWLRNCR